MRGRIWTLAVVSAMAVSPVAMAKGKKGKKESCWVEGKKDKKAKTSDACSKAGGTWSASAPGGEAGGAAPAAPAEAPAGGDAGGAAPNP